MKIKIFYIKLLYFKNNLILHFINFQIYAKG